VQKHSDAERELMGMLLSLSTRSVSDDQEMLDHVQVQQIKQQSAEAGSRAIRRSSSMKQLIVELEKRKSDLEKHIGNDLEKIGQCQVCLFVCCLTAHQHY